MRRIDRLTGRSSVPASEERFSLAELLGSLGPSGMGGMSPVTTWGDQSTEPPPNSFEGYVQAAYKANGIVFALISARMRLFTEARFAWRDWSNGKPGSLYTDQSLAVVQEPWTNGTTGDLLGHMEQDASLAGQFFGVYRNDGRREALRRARPDWVDLVIGSPNRDPLDIDAEVIGIRYYPAGRSGGVAPVSFPIEQVVHYAPIPDPEARFRGMSWLSPVVEEIRSDKAATLHKGRFFDNAATPNLAVTMPVTDRKQFLEAVEAMDRNHKGAANAYKTLWLMGGADVNVVGADLKSLDFKQVQGAGETRMASAAGVPPIIVGLSEGLAAATYSNYGQARRAFADLWARPQWRGAAAALQKVMRRPNATAELWYVEDGISFLQEDQMDAAEILSRRMLTIEAGVRAGFDPETVVKAVDAQDLSLMAHTGLYSVQLQPPTNGTADSTPA